MAYKIMISYSWKNVAERMALTSKLENVDGVEVISDVRITYGTAIHSTILKMIDECDGVIALLTPKSISSKEVLEELVRANERHKFIIPVISENVDFNALPYFLKDIRQIRYSDEEFDKMVAELISLIQQKVKPSIPKPSVPKPQTPPPPKEIVARVYARSGGVIDVFDPGFVWSATAYSFGGISSSTVKRKNFKLVSDSVEYTCSLDLSKEVRILSIEKEKGAFLQVETILSQSYRGKLHPPDESTSGSFSLSVSTGIPKFEGKDNVGTDISIQMENISRIELLESSLSNKKDHAISVDKPMPNIPVEQREISTATNYQQLWKIIVDKPKNAVFGKFDKELLIEAFDELEPLIPKKYSQFTPSKFVKIVNTLEERHKKQIIEFVAFSYQQATSASDMGTYGISGALLVFKMEVDFPGLTTEPGKKNLVFELFGNPGIEKNPEHQKLIIDFVWNRQWKK